MEASLASRFRMFRHVSLEKALNSRVSTGGGVNHFGKPSGKPIEPNQLEFILRCLAYVPRLNPKAPPVEYEGKGLNPENLTLNGKPLPLQPRSKLGLRWPPGGEPPYRTLGGTTYHLELGMAQEMVHVVGAVAHVGVCLIGGYRVELVGMEPWLTTEAPQNHRLGNLPEPRRDGPVSALDCIEGWRPTTAFQEGELGWREIGQLLWAGYGCTPHTTYRRNSEAFRRQGKTIPSASATYTLILYILSLTGGFSYVNWDERRQASNHSVEALTGSNLIPELLSRIKLPEAPCYILAASKGRLAPLYSVMEAGYAALHICLQAQALGLGAHIQPLGPDDVKALRTLLPTRDHPIVLLPVGHAKERDQGKALQSTAPKELSGGIDRILRNSPPIGGLLHAPNSEAFIRENQRHLRYVSEDFFLPPFLGFQV